MRGHPPQNVYALTPKGRAVLAEKYGLPAEQIPGVPHPPANVAQHVFAVNDVRVAIVLALRGEGRVRLVSFRPFWELRRGSMLAKGALVPDALVTFEDRTTATTWSWAVEVDLGADPLSVLRAKIERYRQAFVREEPVFGVSGFRVVVFFRSQGRLRSALACLRHGFGQERLYMGSLSGDLTVVAPVAGATDMAQFTVRLTASDPRQGGSAMVAGGKEGKPAKER